MQCGPSCGVQLCSALCLLLCHLIVENHTRLFACAQSACDAADADRNAGEQLTSPAESCVVQHMSARSSDCCIMTWRPVSAGTPLNACTVRAEWPRRCPHPILGCALHDLGCVVVQGSGFPVSLTHGRCARDSTSCRRVPSPPDSFPVRGHLRSVVFCAHLKLPGAALVTYAFIGFFGAAWFGSDTQGNSEHPPLSTF